MSILGRRVAVASALLIAFAAVSVPSASAGGAGKITNYSDPNVSNAWSIRQGPDGALWFTTLYGQIGRLDPLSGNVTLYGGPPAMASPYQLALGPDGAFWFVDRDKNTVGRIDVATKAIVIYGQGSSVTYPQGIVLGSDHAMWFTNRDTNTIGRIDPTTKVVTAYADTKNHTISSPNGR